MIKSRMFWLSALCSVVWLFAESIPVGAQPPSRLGYPPSRMTGSADPVPDLDNLRNRAGVIPSASSRSTAALTREAYRAARNVRHSYDTDRLEPAVVELVQLYQSLAVHPLRHHPRIKRLQREMEQFLIQVSVQLQRELAQAAAQPAMIPEQAGVLAQQMGAWPGAAVGAPVAPGAAGLGPAGPNAARLAAAQELVELIQTVISPQVWDVNGGPGAVVYYDRLQVLVVRAPGEVHQQLGGVLNGLRNAGP